MAIAHIIVHGSLLAARLGFFGARLFMKLVQMNVSFGQS